MLIKYWEDRYSIGHMTLFQDLKARYEEKERLIGRFWKERAVYIAIIVGSISIQLTIIMMLIR